MYIYFILPFYETGPVECASKSMRRDDKIIVTNIDLVTTKTDVNDLSTCNMNREHLQNDSSMPLSGTLQEHGRKERKEKRATPLKRLVL